MPCSRKTSRAARRMSSSLIVAGRGISEYLLNNAEDGPCQGLLWWWSATPADRYASTMKRALLIAAAALVPATAAAAETTRPHKQYPLEQLLKTPSLAGASFSADERSIAYSSDESGIYNVYTVPVSGGKPRALTKNKDSSFLVGYFPKDDRILYTHDRGG